MATVVFCLLTFTLSLNSSIPVSVLVVPILHLLTHTLLTVKLSEYVLRILHQDGVSLLLGYSKESKSIQQLNLTADDTGTLFLLNFAFAVNYLSPPFHSVLAVCGCNEI